MANIIQPVPGANSGIILSGKADPVRVSSEVAVSKKAWVGLDKEARQALKTSGVQGLSKLMQTRKGQSAADNYIAQNYIKIGENNYIDKKTFSNLDTAAQKQIIENGMAGYEDYVRTEFEKQINGKSVKLKSGELVSEEVFNKLSLDARNALIISIDTYNRWAESQGSKADALASKSPAIERRPTPPDPMDKARAGKTPDGTIFRRDGYEYVVLSDALKENAYIPKGWEACEGNFIRRKIEDKPPDGAVIIMNWNPSDPIPSGWEQMPDSQMVNMPGITVNSNTIRLIASCIDPKVSLTPEETTNLDATIQTQYTDINNKITALNTKINKLFGRDGDGWYSAPPGLASDPEAVTALMDERLALVEQRKILSLYIGRKNEVKLGGTEITPEFIQHVAAFTSDNLTQHIKPDGTIDIFAALKDPDVSDDELRSALEMNTTNFRFITEMSPYIKPDGTVDIIGALKDTKVRDASVVQVMGLDDKKLADFKTLASYAGDEGNVNIAQMYNDNLDYETIHRLIGHQQSDYDAWQTLKNYVSEGGELSQGNLMAAVLGGLTSANDYPGYGITSDDIGTVTELIAHIKESDPEGYAILTTEGGVAYDSHFKANNTQLPDKTWMPNEALDSIKESDPEGYKLLISEGDEAYDKYIKANNVQLPDGAWFNLKELFAMGDPESEAYNKEYYDILITEGFEAYQEHFEANNTQLPDKTWMPNKALDSIKESNPEGYEILTTEGGVAYDKYIKANNTQVSDDRWIPNTVLENIEQTDPEGWKVYQSDGWEAYQDYLDKTYVKLPDDQYFNKNVLNSMNDANNVNYNPKAYEILTTEGYDEYIKIFNETTEWLTDIGAVVTDANGNQSFNLQSALETEDKILGRKWLDNMAVVFGKDYEDARKLFLATSISRSPYGSPPIITDQEYAEMIKPENISHADYSKIIPYIKPSGTDIAAAISAGVPDSTILTVTGITNEDLEEFKWLERYNANGDLGKTGMAIAKDPKTLLTIAKDAGIGMVPVYGTVYHWDNMNTFWKVASIGGDILFFVPLVKGVSVAVKTGQSISKAMLKGLVLASRDTLVAPYNIVRHPKQVVKTMLAPIEFMIRKGAIPLATTFRGPYSKDMDITKVLAGMTNKEAMRTHKSMKELIRRVTAGEKNVKIPIEGIGTLRYKGSGLTKVMPNWTGTSTPFGEVFKGLGVDVKGQGMFMSPEHYLGLSFQTATGKAPLYIYKGKELLGVIDDAGKAINSSGRTIGRIAEGTKILGLDNKMLGTLTNDFKVINKTNEIVGSYKGGAIVTDNASLIGKYYSGQPYTKNGKLIGHINKTGAIVDKSGKVISTMAGKERVIGIVPETAKIVNDAGKVIGKGKGAPAFAMVYTKGVQELPKWVQKAGSMAKMEKRAWELFKTGEYGNDLYPVFKQYAKWIELEGLLPPGTKLIPLVGGNGKPVVMFTRDPAGRKIEIPLMQVVDKDWFNKSMQITKEIQAADIIPTPMPLKNALQSVKNIPPKAVNPLLAWLKNHKEAHIIGSAGETVFTKGKIKAIDLDIAVPNPEKVVGELTDILKTSGKQVRNNGKSVIEVYNNKKGLWEKAIDISPLDWAKSNGLKTTNVDGVKVQTPASQVSNLLTRMADNFEGKGYSRFVRYVKALGKDVDLGIGAKPPTFKDMIKLKSYGAYNTVRDIFVKGLTKETVSRVNAMAPDLEPQTKALLQQQQRLAAQQESYRRAAVSSAKAGRPQGLKSKEKELDKLSKDIEEMRTTLEEALVARAQALAPITNRISGSSKTDKRLYNKIINKSPYAVTRAPSRQPTSSRIKLKTDDVKTYTPRAPRGDITGPVRGYSKSETKTYAAKTSRAIGDIVSKIGRVAVPSEKAKPTEVPRTAIPRLTRKVTSPEGGVAKTPSSASPAPYEYYNYKSRTLPGVKYIKERRALTTNGEEGKKEKKKKPRGKGEISWRQGAFWITLHPRVGGGYVTAYSKEPPAGYKQRKRRPNETFFTRGDTSTIPPQIKMDMGIVDVKISPTGVPKLKFKRT